VRWCSRWPGTTRPGDTGERADCRFQEVVTSRCGGPWRGSTVRTDSTGSAVSTLDIDDTVSTGSSIPCFYCADSDGEVVKLRPDIPDASVGQRYCSICPKLAEERKVPGVVRFILRKAFAELKRGNDAAKYAKSCAHCPDHNGNGLR
jgi:hypothetical protein